MKEAIEIKNAGPLRHIKIDEIKPFTFLIGESGSGKSVFMKTLMLMRFIYKKLNIRSALKNSGIKSPFRLHIESLLHDDMANYFGSGKSGEVIYTVNDRYTIKISKGKLDTSGAKHITSDDLTFLKESWVTDMRSTIPMWLEKQATLPEAGFYFKETALDFDKAISTANDLEMPFLGMAVQVKNAGHKRKIFLRPADGSYAPVELRFTSSGMQSTTPLIALAHYFAKSFSFKDAIQRSIVNYLYEQDKIMEFRPNIEFGEMPRLIHMHVEEPELSLYPQAQCMLVEQLAATIKNAESDRSMYLMMATHSPYIINYLNVLLSRPSDLNSSLTCSDLAVYRFAYGEIRNLMSSTADGQWIVDTGDLTEPMTNILKEYHSLKKH